MIGWIVAAAVLLTLAFLFSYPSLQRRETARKRQTDPRYTPPRVMGIIDELHHPDAHATRQIVEAEYKAPAQAPLPGDRR
jgi:hypothetical protein